MDSLVDTYLYSDKKDGDRKENEFLALPIIPDDFSPIVHDTKKQMQLKVFEEKNKNKGGNMQSAYMK